MCCCELSRIILSVYLHHVVLLCCSQVKLWEVPSEGITGNLSSAKATFGPMEVRGRDGEGGEGLEGVGR